MLSPRQAFEDNIRPAELLLRVYRLLECDAIQTDGEMITSLRAVVGAVPDEGLMLVYNEVFLGLIRDLSLTNFKYLSSKKGIHAVAALLSIEKPWPQIAEKLGRDRKDLMNIVDETARRRNDIVHRADRMQSDPGGDAQEISYSWSKQAVDTIMHVCLALDELVAARMKELQAENAITAEAV